MASVDEIESYFDCGKPVGAEGVRRRSSRSGSIRTRTASTCSADLQPSLDDPYGEKRAVPRPLPVVDPLCVARLSLRFRITLLARSRAVAVR